MTIQSTNPMMQGFNSTARTAQAASDFQARFDKARQIAANTASESPNDLRSESATSAIEGQIRVLAPAQRAAMEARVVDAGRLNGDYTSGYAHSFTAPADHAVLPSGAAASSVDSALGNTAIDKTSKLYEHSLELESYFVKIMLSSMRNSVTKSGLGSEENSFARNMYDDMLYDELAISMTKTAGFGLADQIYLELDRTSGNSNSSRGGIN